jgi:hypothetical protein
VENSHADPHTCSACPASVSLEGFLKILGWVLIVSSIGSLLLSFIQGVSLRDSVLIPCPFVALLALYSCRQDLWTMRRREQSKFYLDSCVRTYDEADGLLRDGTTNESCGFSRHSAIRVSLLYMETGGERATTQNRQMTHNAGSRHLTG